MMDLYIQAWDLVKFDFGGCVLAARPNIIIVPSATRLKMSWKHPKIRIFSLADKKWMHSRNGNYKALRISFYFRRECRPVDSSLARFTKNNAKQMVTIPDRSEGIVTVST